MPKTSAPQNEAAYDGDQIQVLEGLEPVRRRPGMYIGSTSSRGLTHLIREIVDNSIDEALAGFCDRIEINMSQDGTVQVTDNGRGIPVGINKAKKTAAVHLVFEVLHAGGKFGGGGYVKSGGLHGVGASVTNALSEWLEVEVRRDGKLHQVKYADAKRVQDCKVIGKASDTGTTVRWKYDAKLFDKGAAYDVPDLEEVLQQKAYLVPGLKIVFAREGHKTRTYHSKDGLKELVTLAAEEREPLHKPILFSTGPDGIKVLKPGAKKDSTDEDDFVSLEVDVALAWTRKADDRTYSFANIIPTQDHGTHVTGFRGALTKALNNFAYETGKLKKDARKTPESFEGRDITAALTAAVLVKLPEPQFEGQTKGKLNNSEARTAVQTFLYQAISDWLVDKKNATAAKAILDRCLHARKYRLAEDQVDKNFNPNSIFSDTGQSEKLADCDPNSDPGERELFIVEGDSAGGTAREARDSRFQAILPLRGKPLNVMTSKEKKVIENAEIKALITALGGRHENVDGTLVVSLPKDKRRYAKVILLADADADGAHITALCIGMLAELTPAMIHEGRVFLSRPPLFKINLDTRGDKFVYAYTEDERSALVAKHKRGADDVTRFKGLGEMNAEQLEETVMDPKTRTLYQLTVEDLQTFDQTLALILGDKSGAAARRKQFLEEEANELLVQDEQER